MIYKSLVKKVSIPADKKTKQKEYIKSGKLPIIDQGKELIGGYTDNLAMLLQCDLPVIVFGDHTRNVKFVSFEFGAGADGIKVLRPCDSVLPKYLYYGTQYLVFRLPDKGYARHYQHIEKMDLPVPPLEEQARIVARIEEMFSQLESGVETLRQTKEQLAVYRQAVLKEAFDSLETVTVDSICTHVTDGDHQPPPKAEKGVPFIMISNIENNTINWNGTAFVGEEYYNALNDKRRPKRGDVLYTVTGSFGIPVMVDFDKRFCFQRHIALLRPNESITQKYLFYALQEPSVYIQARDQATGTAQKTVGLAILRRLNIPYIKSIKKQEQIAAKIEASLSVCDQIDQTVDTALHQAEALRQSILKKAFEGGL